MISLSHHQLACLGKAATQVDSDSITTYLALKARLHSTEAADRAEFRHQFTQYYRLNSGGLTEPFKQRYFELLFALDPNQADPYTPLLLELYEFPRRQGDKALQCSFVSKLVAIHDEARPIYDGSVSDFFGVSAPSAGSVEFRISGFVTNLNYIKEHYEAWTQDERFQPLLDRLCAQHPTLRECHPVRLCDFLVWTVGTHNIE